MAFHDLCTINKAPAGCGLLLGLTQKFCLERAQPPAHFQQSLQRFMRSVRLKRFLEENPPAGPQKAGDVLYIPGLYVPSTFTPPRLDENNPNDTTELAIYTMYGKLEKIAQQLALKPSRTNLTRGQHKILRDLASDDRFVITPTDKNLGPAIMDREVYIKRVLQDHLTNEEFYKQLTPAEALGRMATTKRQILRLVDDHKESLTTAEQQWFKRQERAKFRTPQFYIMPKVHKTPFGTRPVESCVGSFMEVASKWLDYQMKRLLPLSRTYIKDSKELHGDLMKLGKLPTNAKLFTADAVAMYPNIPIEHGIEVFETWFEKFADEIPDDFPKELFLKLLRTVMTENIFQFGDTFWLQIDGTAIGTSCACLFATMYMALCERATLLRKYKDNLILLKRFIDDMLGVWKYTDEQSWLNFQADMNAFGPLDWIVEPLSNKVDFLDLTIEINKDQRISTKTYEKPMNLHLYIPPASAHPPGVLKSIVFGNLQRYRWHNTSNDDYVAQVRRFSQRLIARGHSPETVRQYCMEAASSIDSIERAGRKTRDTADPSDTLFFHWEYHPRGISRQLIRREYNERCAATSGYDRMVVAFSRPRNLRDALMKSRLPDKEGENVSDVFDNLKAGAAGRDLTEV
jgi:hypothetical protein